MPVGVGCGDSRGEVDICPPPVPDKMPRIPEKGTPIPRVNPNIQKLEFKPKAVLGHDLGAGAACLKCGDLCPGLELHFWRRICKSCKCRPEEHNVHDVGPDPGKIRIGRLFDQPTLNKITSINPKLYHVLNQQTNNKNIKVSKNVTFVSIAERKAVIAAQMTNVSECMSVVPRKYDWIPPCSDAHMVGKYMNDLPESARPVQGTEGATKRKQALEYQVPLYDYDASACHSLNDEETRKLHKYVAQTKSDVVGQAILAETPDKPKQLHPKCHQCKGDILPDTVYLYTDHTGPDQRWHAGCFSCECCSELLVDLLYFYHKGKFYCGRHYGDSVFPRCKACDELIFSSEYTRAEDENWHLNHFCCWHCDVELGGKRYMVKQNNPHCMQCYIKLFARTCQRCHEKIPADVKRISHRDLHWHAQCSCFHCDMCKESIVEKKFIIKGGLVFCSSLCKKTLTNPDSMANNGPTVTDL